MIAKPVSRHGRVTAVSMMKDEGPFLLEWVAHHLAVGFSDILVFTNDCSDGTDDMLIRLQELGLVQHRRNRIPEGIKPQPSAIKHAQAEPFVGDSDWVMLLDADEFLCVKQGDGSLDGLLDAVVERDANGIVITWRVFGSGGVKDWSRAPVSEQYLRAAPPMWNKGWGVKTLFRFDPDHWKLGIHRPKIKNKHLDTGFPDEVRWLNGSGKPMEDYFKFRGWRSIARTVGYDWVQLNHYAVKSMDSYAIRKLRGNVNFKKDKYNADYWSLQDRNEVYDDSILRHAAKRAEICEALLADSILRDLHEAAVGMAEARLEEFKTIPAYGDLIESLEAASKIPITQVEAKPPKARDPEKIAAKMSDIERRQTAHSAVTAMDAEQGPDPLYRDPPGPTDLQVEWRANHEIELPADVAVFTDTAVMDVLAGKFLRNHARRLPDLLPDGSVFLEVGGIGFLAAVVSLRRPDVRTLAAPTLGGLADVAKAIVARNDLATVEIFDWNPKQVNQLLAEARATHVYFSVAPGTSDQFDGPDWLAVPDGAAVEALLNLGYQHGDSSLAGAKILAKVASVQ